MKYVLLSALVSFGAMASTAKLPTESSSEKCVLVEATQDPKNPYDALLGVKEINLFFEKSFMQTGNSSKPLDTMILFGFSDIVQDSFAQAVGSKYYMTKQTHRFVDAKGKPVDINSDDLGVFQTLYTHEYKKVNGKNSLSIKAVHSVVQITDHWASNTVVVDYDEVQWTPVARKTFKAKFKFKCNEFEQAQEMLAE